MAFINIYNFLNKLKKGHLHDKLKNSAILQNNRKEKRKYKKGTKRIALTSFCKENILFASQASSFYDS